MSGLFFYTTEKPLFSVHDKLVLAMQVKVLLFGVLKDLVARDSEMLAIPDGATAGDVLKHYERQLDPIRGGLSSIAVSVNQEYAHEDTQLHPGDEVALLPPVSGGAPKTQITRDRIDTPGIVEAIKAAQDGAVVVFEGIVRNHSRGRRTLFLEYEAYEPMALKEMDQLAAEALARFHVRDLTVIHRLGHLEIGETSVLIVVASPHRAAAFDACRCLIHALKRTVPIWKKEFFEDGAVWADGEPFPESKGAVTNPQPLASK